MDATKLKVSEMYNGPTAAEPHVPMALTASALDLKSLIPFLSAPTDKSEVGWLAHYRVLEVLGKGGMGMVLKAEDTHLRRLVALKVMLPELFDHHVARDRFLREARAMASVRSDNVVTIFQVGQERDLPFFAMEFLTGQTLRDWLEVHPRPSLQEVLHIARQIALGLADAHGQGLIHRDIKPANIWLESRGGVSGGVVSGGVVSGGVVSGGVVSGGGNSDSNHSPLTPHLFRVKILDFGLAHTSKEANQLTNPGTVVGTPFFMSPEQARGETVDARSDLFSLGTVLYFMCTRLLPFDGDNPMAVLTALATKTPPSPRELNHDIPQALSDLIMRLLEKEPARRPAAAREVIDLLHVIEGKVHETWNSGLCAITPSPALALPPTTTCAPVPPEATARPRRRLLAGLGAALVAAAVLTVFLTRTRHQAPALPKGDPIRIGILHSLTGPMALSEKPVVDAVVLALEELNQHGGVLGRPVEFVLEDGESEETVFAARAEKLITQDRVAALFGCWTSASRKAVLEVLEKHDHLLFYPVQYEGLEQTAHILYLGPTPNQQILPALRYAVGFLNRRKWFLVGSDYVFPRAANEIIKEEAKKLDCEIVGEEYLLLESTQVGDVVRKIVSSQPTLILNTLNGEANVPFFRELRKAGIDSKRIPTLSFSLSEEELASLHAREIVGDYSAGTYFQTIDRPQNRDFLKRFAAKFPSRTVISDPMQSAYSAVHLWARAVALAGTEEVRSVRQHLGGLQFDAPQGLITIDPKTRHSMQQARIGQVTPQGKFQDIFVTPQPVAAEPFPSCRTQAEWNAFLTKLHQAWGGRWSNAGR